MSDDKTIMISKKIYDISECNKQYKEEVYQLILDFSDAIDTLYQGYEGSQDNNIKIFKDAMVKQLIRLKELFNIAELYSSEIYNTFEEKDQYYAKVFEMGK